ncbi:phage protein [Paraglaciecola sp. T6c]|uniref:hypothetical protein n=1 Tax=Pseudoalteromonas atlantica (strain T6c / ATCC BAA-1087) TaxID=3042615 RepID=UPI00005C54AE|nr:hypothetical protein [Paraglaciecola sp. T6c]ABG39214.1 phage protein [Paraglaciecola sp. T6c]
MKNKLIDLNNHLFAQLERLGEESLNGEALKDEIARGKSVAVVANQIIATQALALDVAVKYDELSLNAKKHIDGILIEQKS